MTLLRKRTVALGKEIMAFTPKRLLPMNYIVKSGTAVERPLFGQVFCTILATRTSCAWTLVGSATMPIATTPSGRSVSSFSLLIGAYFCLSPILSEYRRIIKYFYFIILHSAQVQITPTPVNRYHVFSARFRHRLVVHQVCRQPPKIYRCDSFL